MDIHLVPPPWDWEKLDQSATLAATVFVPVYVFGIVLSAVPAFRRAVHERLVWGGLGRLAIVLSLLSTIVVFTVADHDPDAWFGQATAAWVQAFGALGALGIAVLIDVNAAKRLREDREAEWAEQRRERVDVERHARAARVHAIFKAKSAMDRAAGECRAYRRERDGIVALAENTTQRIKAAAAVLDHYLKAGAEIDADTLGAIAMTAEALDYPLRLAVTNNTWDDDGAAQHLTAAFAKASGNIGSVLEQLHRDRVEAEREATLGQDL